MLKIDLSNKRAFVAGVADDGGFGFAIAHALAEAGASVCVGTWPPALTIFNNLLERGKMDESRKLSSGALLQFERVYPLDAVYDRFEDIPEEVRTGKRYKEVGDCSIDGVATPMWFRRPSFIADYLRILLTMRPLACAGSRPIRPIG